MRESFFIWKGEPSFSASFIQRTIHPPVIPGWICSTGTRNPPAHLQLLKDTVHQQQTLFSEKRWICCIQDRNHGAWHSSQLQMSSCEAINSEFTAWYRRQFAHHWKVRWQLHRYCFEHINVSLLWQAGVLIRKLWAYLQWFTCAEWSHWTRTTFNLIIWQISVLTDILAPICRDMMNSHFERWKIMKLFGNITWWHPSFIYRVFYKHKPMIGV